jgi:hypothetical protein
LDIRRNDYIASIRHDISELDLDLNMFETLKRQNLELIQYCKDNRLWRFKRVVKRELRLLISKDKWQRRRKKRLVKLLAKAEKYTPGRNG